VGVRLGGAPTKEAGGGAPLYHISSPPLPESEAAMPRYWASTSKRCEDCGRTQRMENLLEVEWIFTTGERRVVTWLRLCKRCANRMARALAEDPTCELVFHPF
jgi:hypothetical protein